MIKLRKIETTDYDFRKELLSDEKTMFYNAIKKEYLKEAIITDSTDYNPLNGTISFGIEEQQYFTKFLLESNEVFYGIIENEEGKLIGEYCYYKFGNACHIGLTILNKYRRKGYGRQVLKQLTDIVVCGEDQLGKLIFIVLNKANQIDFSQFFLLKNGFIIDKENTEQVVLRHKY